MSCNPCKNSDNWIKFDPEKHGLVGCKDGKEVGVFIDPGNFGLSEAEVCAVIDTKLSALDLSNSVSQEELTQCKSDLMADYCAKIDALRTEVTEGYCRKVDQLRVELNNNINNLNTVLQEQLNGLQLQITECCEEDDVCTEVLVTANCMGSESTWNEITYTGEVTGEINPDDPKYLWEWTFYDSADQVVGTSNDRVNTQTYAAGGSYYGSVTVTDTSFDPDCVGSVFTQPCSIIDPSNGQQLTADINCVYDAVDCTIAVDASDSVLADNYMFFLNGVMVQDSMTPTYTHTITENDTHSFSVLVSDGVTTDTATCADIEADCILTPPVCTAVVCTREDNGDVSVLVDSTGATSYTWSLGVDSGTSTTNPFVIPRASIADAGGTMVVNSINDDGQCEGSCSVSFYNPCPVVADFSFSCERIEGTNCVDISPIQVPTIFNITNYCATTDDDQSPTVNSTTIDGDCGSAVQQVNGQVTVDTYCGVGEVLGLTSGQLGDPTGLTLYGSDIEDMYTTNTDVDGANTDCTFQIKLTPAVPQTTLQETIGGVVIDGTQANYTPSAGGAVWFFDKATFNDIEWAALKNAMNGSFSVGDAGYQADPCDVDGNVMVCFETFTENKTVNMTVSIDGCPDVVVPVTCEAVDSPCDTIQGGKRIGDYDVDPPFNYTIDIEQCGTSSYSNVPTVPPNSTGSLGTPSGNVNGADVVFEFREKESLNESCYLTLGLQGNRAANFFSATDYAVNGVGFSAATSDPPDYNSVRDYTLFRWQLTNEDDCNALDSMCTEYERCTDPDAVDSTASGSGKSINDGKAEACRPYFNIPEYWTDGSVANADSVQLVSSDGASSNFSLASAADGNVNYQSISDDSIGILILLLDGNGDVVDQLPSYTYQGECELEIECEEQPDSSIDMVIVQ